MSRVQASERTFTCGLAVVAVLLFAQPASAQGGKVVFRNDTASPIIVQGFSIINRTVRAGKRHVLQPGQSGQDVILTAGNKLIVIQDAKQPTRTLYQDTIVLTGADILLSVQVEPPAAEKDPTPGGNAKAPPAKPTTPKLMLVPVKPPAPTAPGTSAGGKTGR